MRVLEITSLPLAPCQLRIHACMRILRVLSCKVRFGKIESYTRPSEYRAVGHLAQAVTLFFEYLEFLMSKN